MEEYSAQLINKISRQVANTPLMRYIVKCGSAHALISLIRKSKGKKLSRSQRRKFFNKRRRWFTDNIIMHHRRIHEKNRHLVLNPQQEVVKKQKKKRKLNLQRRDKKTKEHNQKEIIHRGLVLKGRVDAKRLKARSRWLTVST